MKKRDRFRSAKTGRVLIFTLGFMIFIALSLYSLSYIKKQISLRIAEKEPSSDLTRTPGDVDAYIAEALFNMGVSISNVKSEKISPRGGSRAAIGLKEMHIELPEGINEMNVKQILEKSLAKSYIEPNFRRGDDSLTAEIEIGGIQTHRIRFDFNRRQRVKQQLKGIKDKEPPSAPRKLAKIDKDIPTVEKPAVRIFKEDKPKVVIIVDDLGLNKEPIDKLVELKASLSFAVLPNLPYSRYAAEVANRNGWDVILHLPMEPKESSGYFAADAGDGALLVGLPKNEILSKLERNLSSIPNVKGVNNHMGSKFTENGELMELILKDIRKKGLFFIDSRTSPNTKGFDMARKLGIKTAKRDLFLDNAPGSQDYVRSQIKKLISISKENGHAIGICHPYPQTVSVLSEMIEEIKKEVDIVPASGVVN